MLSRAGQSAATASAASRPTRCCASTFSTRRIFASTSPSPSMSFAKNSAATADTTPSASPSSAATH